MRTRGRLLIILFLSLAVLIFTLDQKKYLNPTTFFRRGVVIGNVNLSNKSWDSGYNLLLQRFRTPIYINLVNTSRAVTLKEIGISIDRNQLMKYTKTCRVGNLRIFCQNTSNEQVDTNTLLVINNETLTTFLEELENEVQYYANNTVISFEDYSFMKLTPDAKILLDKTKFTTLAGIEQLISENTIKIQLSPKPMDDREKQYEATRFLIANMTNPLLIKYGRNPIYIDSKTLQTFISEEEKNGYLYGIIQSDNIEKYLQDLGEEYATEDIVVLENQAIQAIQRALLYRATSLDINNAIVLPLEGKSKSQGELHDKYLEIIKSQQRLYRFENGELVKTYVISTGLTWETPAGDFAVLGKQKMAISYFGNWYMPNYLPVGTVFGYRFGFHEIPYHMDAAGNIFSRDPNSMGSPATGGCIQLTKEDSLELFEWAEIGTPVYIHE
jgi:hypothetical protein